MRRSSATNLRLPEDVILSVQGVTRAKVPPEPELPPWLVRILPKSGIAGQAGGGFDDEFGDELLEEDADVEPTALEEVSFDLRRGEGLGVLGPDGQAVGTLMRILVGAVHPTTGRVVVRGRVASLHRTQLMGYLGSQWGRKGVFVVARFLHWPRSLLRRRWDEIEELAAADELKHLGTRKFRLQWTGRLLLSAALNIDAPVYVVDHTIHSDPDFAVRCFELLEQRQRDGAVIVQSAKKMVEDVARLCNEVIWIENGKVLYRGTPLEVAIDVDRAHREELHPLSAPVFASLADPYGAVEVAADGGVIEFELGVLRKQLEIGLALELSDGNGHSLRLEQPERFLSEVPGVYRFRIVLPPGLLQDATYEARLIREISVPGGEPAAPAEMLRFDVLANGRGGAPADEEPTFALSDEGDDAEPVADAVKWHVSRAAD